LREEICAGRFSFVAASNWKTGQWENGRRCEEVRKQYVDANEKAAPSEWCGPICAGAAAGAINAGT
jgi:hypothetical protein